MPQTRVEETRRFIAFDDDGRRHVVVEHTTFVEIRTLGGSVSWVPESKSLALADGGAVTAVAAGCFTIDHTGTVIRCR